jgi:hypothetical protein
MDDPFAETCANRMGMYGRERVKKSSFLPLLRKSRKFVEKR